MNKCIIRGILPGSIAILGLSVNVTWFYLNSEGMWGGKRTTLHYYSISKGLKHGCWSHLFCKRPPSKYTRLSGPHAGSGHVLLLLFCFAFYNSLNMQEPFLGPMAKLCWPLIKIRDIWKKLRWRAEFKGESITYLLIKREIWSSHRGVVVNESN